MKRKIMILGVTLLISFLLSLVFLSLMVGVEFSDISIYIERNPMLLILSFITIGLVLLTILFATGAFIQGEWNKEMLPIFLSTFFSLVFTFFILFSIRESIGDMDKKLLALLLIGLLGVNSVIHYLTSSVSFRERDLSKRRTLEEQRKGKTELYKEIIRNNDETRKSVHDFKNKLDVILTLIKDEEYKALKEYVNDVNDGLSNRLVIDTNNTVINAILNTKYREAMENGIHMIFKISDLKDIGIVDDDLVVILGNLLDNAIEGAKNSEEKTVRLKIDRDEESLIIGVNNTYSGEINRNLDRKKKGLFHGLGISNIIETVERLGGQYSISHDEEFSFTIILGVSKWEK